MATDVFKRIDVDGIEYSIKKFTAKDGLKVARLLLAKIAPLIPAIEGMGDDVFEAVAPALESLGDSELENLVDMCLRVCYRELPAGRQAVIDTTGHYGVPEVEYDIPLTLRLCFEAIRWGASDFFGGNGSGLKKIFDQVS